VLVERVHHLHDRLIKVTRVSRDHDQVMDERGSCNHSIQQRKRNPLLPQANHQFGPASADRSVPRETFDGLHKRPKPLFELHPLTPARKRENADAQFAQNDGVHDEIALVGAQPIDYLAAGHRLRRLAEHVCIDQVSHANLGTLISAVVSVRSIGLNQPLTGHASSIFTKPSLRRRSFRFNRYSPQSIRSTSNSCPGLMPSCCRNSAGRTICPLVETVVFIHCKISSYAANLNPVQKQATVPLRRRAHSNIEI